MNLLQDNLKSYLLEIIQHVLWSLERRKIPLISFTFVKSDFAFLWKRSGVRVPFNLPFKIRCSYDWLDSFVRTIHIRKYQLFLLEAHSSRKVLRITSSKLCSVISIFACDNKNRFLVMLLTGTTLFRGRHSLQNGNIYLPFDIMSWNSAKIMARHSRHFLNNLVSNGTLPLFQHGIKGTFWCFKI